MSIELYEETMRKINMYDDLEISARHKEEGRVRNARASLSELKEKYGTIVPDFSKNGAN